MTPTAPLPHPHADQTGDLVTPTRPANLARRGFVAATALVLVAVGGLLLHDSQWDLPAVAALNELHVGWFADFTTTVYFLLDPPGAIILSGVITATILVYDILRRGRSTRPVWVRAVTYASTVLITWLPITIFKAIFTRPRPDVDQLPHPFVEYQGNTSYPSGHTSFAVISVVAIFLVVTTTNRTRAVVTVLGTCWVAFIVVVVVSNGVHFPTDSTASLVWGLGVAPLVAGMAQRSLARAPRAGGSA